MNVRKALPNQQFGRPSIIETSPTIGLQVYAASLHKEIGGPFCLTSVKDTCPDIIWHPSDSCWQSAVAVALQVNTARSHEKVSRPLRCAFLKNGCSKIRRHFRDNFGQPIKTVSLQIDATFLHKKIGGPFRNAAFFHIAFGIFFGKNLSWREKGYRCYSNHPLSYIGLHSISLLAWSGEQRQKPQDDVAHHPDPQNHRRPNGPPNCSSGAFSIRAQITRHFAELREVAEQPNHHQNVENNKRPFKYFPEKAAFGFLDRVTTARAVKCFRGNVFIATGASGQSGHLIGPQQILLLGESNGPNYVQRHLSRQCRLPSHTRSSKSDEIGPYPHNVPPFLRRQVGPLTVEPQLLQSKIQTHPHSASGVIPASVVARRRNKVAMTRSRGGAFGHHMYPRIIAMPRVDGPRAGLKPAHHLIQEARASHNMGQRAPIVGGVL